jgi:hypothetical protein
VDDKEVEEAAQTLKELCSFKSTDLGPHEKYESPVAASHEIGWHSKVQLVRSHPMFNAARASCDVTQFADTYWNLTGYAPTPLAYPSRLPTTPRKPSGGCLN